MSQTLSVNIKATGDQVVQQQLAQMRASLDKVKSSAGPTNAAFGKVRDTVGKLGVQAAGVKGPLGELASQLSNLAIGGGLMLGVAAGITLLIGLFNKFRQASKDLKESQSNLQRTLEDVYGAGAEKFDLDKANEKLLKAQENLLKWQRSGKPAWFIAVKEAQTEYNNALAEQLKAKQTYDKKVASDEKTRTSELKTQQKEREAAHKAHMEVLKKQETERLKYITDANMMTFDQLLALETLRANAPLERMKAEIKRAMELAKELDRVAQKNIDRILDKNVQITTPKQGQPNVDASGIVGSIQGSIDALSTDGGPLGFEFGVIATNMESNIADSFSDALYNGFLSAFERGNPLPIIQSFGASMVGAIGSAVSDMAKTWLAGIGKTFAKQAAAYLKFGSIMKGLSKWLTNPFTAGIASVAIGAALIALSRSLGAQASGIGGNSYGISGMNESVSSSQNGVAANAKGDATIVIEGGLLDMSNPEQARSLARALESLSNRRVSIVGA